MVPAAFCIMPFIMLGCAAAGAAAGALPPGLAAVGLLGGWMWLVGRRRERNFKRKKEMIYKNMSAHTCV